MIVVTKDDLDLPNTVPLASWAIRHPVESALFGRVVQIDTYKFVLYRNNGHEFMEIATFPTLESLQRSLSNIEGIEYVRKS